MITKKRDVVIGRIMDAALDLLRGEGMLALTQPRVAKAAGLRQSHITYYFPTRSDLVAAVAASVAEKLTAGFEYALSASKPEPLSDRLARIGAPERTRLLLALVLAADREPVVCTLFRRLTKDVRAQIATGLEEQGIDPGPGDIALLHALGVGLAVLDLARAEPASRRETKTTTTLALSRMGKGKRRTG